MGAYLSARESADYCGVSEKTIRNWIAAGRLSAEKSAGAFRIAQEDLDVLRTAGPHRPRGAESVSAEVRADDGPQGAEGSAGSAGVVELVALIRMLQEQLIARTEAAAMWQERAGSLSDRLALAEGKLAVLEAPEASQATIAGQETASVPAATPEAPLPLWRRWWALAIVSVATVLAVLAIVAAVVPRLLGYGW